MKDSPDPSAASRADLPTAKQRATVQRGVNALLDELAPERPPARAGRLPVAVEQHRTPDGCVLQAATSALSVSWFPDAAKDGALGELQVVVWRGFVLRRGSLRRPEGAVVVQELVLRPIERPLDGIAWRATDGTTYDTGALAAHCLALLEGQIRVDLSPHNPADPAT